MVEGSKVKAAKAAAAVKVKKEEDEAVAASGQAVPAVDVQDAVKVELKEEVGIKREREDEENEHSGAAVKRPAVDLDEDDVDDFAEEEEEEEEKFEVGGRRKEAQRFCPYLDSISRHVLDFDFEKVCSVSNSHLNVYACLVCGRYFQGRARGSAAYFHSLENHHHVFMKLDTGKVYCIPDNYEVTDSSLADIKRNLMPKYTPDEVQKLDLVVKYSRGIDGTEYIPGTVGLNNLKNTAYINVIIQALSCVTDLRDFFLLPQNYTHCKSNLVRRFGELLCKMWNPTAFKGQVSPHELFQAISVESNRRYRSDVHSDPAEFLVWFLNSLHRGLGGTTANGSSVIHKVFQGQVRVFEKKLSIKKGQTDDMDDDTWDMEDKPFLNLTLDLPPTPLYSDSLEKNIIPQIPLINILHKFDGETVHVQRGKLHRFKLLKLPNYIMLHIKRFSKNTQFQVEKNPTIVSFPIKKLDLRDFCEIQDDKKNMNTQYDLVSNVCHEGLVTKASYTNEVHDKGLVTKEGVFRVQVLNKSQEQWFQLDDLHIQEILPQVVSISEAYIQIYERSDRAQARKQMKEKLIHKENLDDAMHMDVVS